MLLFFSDYKTGEKSHGTEKKIRREKDEGEEGDERQKKVDMRVHTYTLIILRQGILWLHSEHLRWGWGGEERQEEGDVLKL